MISAEGYCVCIIVSYDINISWDYNTIETELWQANIFSSKIQHYAVFSVNFNLLNTFNVKGT